MKTGTAVLLSLTVFVSLTLSAAAEYGAPDAWQDPASGADDAASGLQETLGGIHGSVGGGGAAHLDGLRCAVLKRVGGDPAPAGGRAGECEESAQSPQDGQQPDGGEAPDARQILRGVADDLDAAADDLQDALDATSGDSKNLLERIWEPVQGLGNEASRVARETVDAVTAAASYVQGRAERALENTEETLRYLLRQLDSIVNPAPEGGEGHVAKSSYHTSSAVVEAPGISTAKIAAGAVIAGGVGLALAAFALLRRLIGLGGVALLSRIPTQEIMKNETRSHIHDIVKTDPGVSLNEIVTRIGISRNAVAYHLAVFESEDIMTSVKDGKYRRYFINGGKYANGAKDVVSAIKNDVTRDVIRFIAKHPGVIQKDVCEAIGTSPSATSWHIRRLEKVGLVEKERVANMVRYRPGPSMAKYDLSDFGIAEARSSILVAPAPAPAFAMTA